MKTYIFERGMGQKQKTQGSLDDARDGDIAVFFYEGRSTTRRIKTIDHKAQRLTTEPLVASDGAAGFKVKFDDITNIIREAPKVAAPSPAPAEPTAEPVTEPAPMPDPDPVVAPPETDSVLELVAATDPPKLAIKAPGGALRPQDSGYRRNT